VPQRRTKQARDRRRAERHFDRAGGSPTLRGAAEGVHLWDSARTDPGFPKPTDVPDLAEVAFSTGTPGHNDIWVVQGRYGFHMSHLVQSGIPLDQMVALARAMVAGLDR
jgi:hypothetical protein